MSKDFRKEGLTFSTKECPKEVITFTKRSTHHLKNREGGEREGRRRGKEEGKEEKKMGGEEEKERRYFLHWVFDAPIVEPHCF